MVARRVEQSDTDAPLVSVVIPAHNEERRLSATLRSFKALDTAISFELIVVDGGSKDETVAIATEHGARVIEQSGTGVGNARHEGAKRARGRWLAFVDADTSVRPSYLEEMLEYVREHDLLGATSQCRVTGPRRAKVPEIIMNHAFPRMGRPVLPGFNTFVEREAYFAAGGFPDVPNEDKAFSRALARIGDVGVHRGVLVETSGRRIEKLGLAGVLWYYFRRDLRALRSSQAGDEQLTRATLAVIALAVVAGGFQLYHGLVLSHLTATFAGIGFLGGIALFMMDLTRPRIAVYGIGFITIQLAIWVYQGTRHGIFGIADSGVQVLLAGVLLFTLWQQRYRDTASAS
jgi:glycosyltransferase involved in cell wall biosynthesis